MREHRRRVVPGAVETGSRGQAIQQVLLAGAAAGLTLNLAATDVVAFAQIVDGEGNVGYGARDP